MKGVISHLLCRSYYLFVGVTMTYTGYTIFYVEDKNFYIGIISEITKSNLGNSKSYVGDSNSNVGL